MPEINTRAAFYAFSGGALWLLGSLLFIGLDKADIQTNRWLGGICEITKNLEVIAGLIEKNRRRYSNPYFTTFKKDGVKVSMAFQVSQ